MRTRELDAAIAAANPIGPGRVAAVALPVDRGSLLDALATESLPDPASGAARLRLPGFAPLLAVLAIVAAAGVFTTPGRAVSSWVGERLGIVGPGEPGGPPALRQLNESWERGAGLKSQAKYVLLVGPVTGQRRSRYEFITYDPAPHPGHPTWPRGPCFELDLTQVRSMSGQGCGTLPKGGEFAYSGVGGGIRDSYVENGKLRFSGELFYVSGRVGPRVASVEATVDGRSVPVQLRPVPEALRRRFKLGGPFGFFVGFFSGVPHGGTLEVTARGAGGEPLGHAKTQLINQVAARKFMCRMMLKSGERAPRAGLEECRQVLGRGKR